MHYLHDQLPETIDHRRQKYIIIIFKVVNLTKIITTTLCYNIYIYIYTYTFYGIYLNEHAKRFHSLNFSLKGPLCKFSGTKVCNMLENSVV